HRAAQTSRLEQHHIVADVFDQEMIEADFAELIYDHGRFGERGVLQQAVEQSGLAGAEKTSQQGERGRCWRNWPITTWRGLAHCAVELTFGLAGLAGLAAGLAALADLPASSALADFADFSPPSVLVAAFFFFFGAALTVWAIVSG